MKWQLIQRLLTGAAVLLALLVAGYLFFVLTPVGQSIDNAGYLGRGAAPRLIALYDGEILTSVRMPTLLIAAAVVFAIALASRAPVAGLLATAGMGIAIEGAEFLKRTLPRTELVAPAGPLPAYFAADTYPSGHTTIGTSIALAVLMVLPARWRAAFAAVAGFIAASYATGVLIIGWHRPSDALGGIAWSGLCMALAATVAVAGCGHIRHERGPIRWRRALVTGVFVVSVIWAAALFAGATTVGAAFVIMMIAIVTAAFALAVWYSRMLETVDWHAPRGQV